VTVTVSSKSSGNPGGGGCNGVLAELMEDNCSVASSFGAVNLPVVLALLLLWVTVARRRRSS